MYCRNRGKQIADGAKFCPYCGTQQAAPVQAQPTQPPRAAQPAPAPQPAPAAYAAPVAPKPKKKRKRWPIVLVVILLLLAALAAVGYLVVLPRWKEQKQAEYLAQANEAINAQDYAAAEDALAQAEKMLSDTKTDLLAAQLAAEQGNYEDAAQKYKAISAKTLQSYTPADGELETIEACVQKTDPTLTEENGERTDANDKREQEISVYVTASVSYDEDGTVNSISTNRYFGNQATYKSSGYLWEYTVDTETGKRKEIKITKYDSDGNVDWADQRTCGKNGKVVSSTNKDGVKTFEAEYYDNGELKKATSYNDDGTLSQIREYDKAGNEIKVTYYDDGAFDAGYEYSGFDEQGNYTHCIHSEADGTTIELTYTYTYNENGQVLNTKIYRIVDSATFEYHNTWDEHGNLTLVTYSEQGGDPEIKKRYVYTYDADGHKTSETMYYGSDENPSHKYMWTNGLMTENIRYYNYNGDCTELDHTYYYYAPKDQQPGEVGPTTYMNMPDY